MSYRRIIFGNDGRIRPNYSEKNKSNNGLLSFTQKLKNMSNNNYQNNSQDGNNNYEEPIKRVSYWSSSLYDETGINFFTTTNKVTKNTANNNNSNEMNDKNQSNFKNSLQIDGKDSIFFHLFPQTQINGQPSRQGNAESEMNNFEYLLTNNFPKRIIKSNQQINNASYYEKLLLVKAMIKTNLLKSETYTISLPNLFYQMKTIHYDNNTMNYYKHFITLNILKDILKLMEETMEILISTDSKGISTIHYNVKYYLNNQNDYNSYNNNISFATKSMPPKLRFKNYQPIEIDSNIMTEKINV